MSVGRQREQGELWAGAFIVVSTGRNLRVRGSTLRIGWSESSQWPRRVGTVPHYLVPGPGMMRVGGEWSGV